MSEQQSINITSFINFSAQHDIAETLAYLASLYPDDIVFSTSFSYEDQVITDYIAKAAPGIQLFTLDTGRLFPETYSTWSATLDKYQLPVTTYYPDDIALKEYVTNNGPNAFYASPELRKQCCHIRKVVPLQKALAGKKIWITGLRAEHSTNRQSLQPFEWDDVNNIIKYHPLLQWSTDEVTAHIHQHNIPYNVLHTRGFVSIGCAPCTRAVKPGEDFRAGRWWWEDNSKKECGLHSTTTAVKA